MARNYKRDRKGRFAKVNTLKVKGAHVKDSLKVKAKSNNAAAVPYARASLRSQTVGINAGVNVPSNRRVSVHASVRVQRRSQGKLEKQIKETDKRILNKLAGKISPHPAADKHVVSAIQKARRKVVNKTLGGQLHVGQGAHARLTTSQSGLPSITIRKGMSRVSAEKRRKAIDDYDRRMETALRGNRAKKPRPQRRNAAAGRKVA